MMKDQRDELVKACFKRSTTGTIRTASDPPKTQPAPQVSQQAIFSAVATLLDEERDTTDRALDELRKRIDGLDGVAILRSAATTCMIANLQSIKGYCDTILYRRARVARGTLPDHLKGLADD